MPFQSEKQRRYLWANEPEIARDWADTYGSRIEKNDGGITRIPLRRGGPGGHEDSYEAGKSYEAAKARSHPKAAGHGRGYADQWQQDALKQFANLSSTTSGPSQIHPKETPIVKEEKKSIGERFKAWTNAQDFKGRKKYMKAYTKKNPAPFYKQTGEGFIWDDWTDEEIMSPENLQLLKDTGYLKNMDQQSGGGDGGGYMGYPSYAAWLAAQGQRPSEEIEVDEEEEVVEDPRNFQGLTMAELPYPKYHERRIPAAYGGIMDTATGRRGYFLGSIGNIFGSVAKAAKKVFKSDVGKAAMLGVGIYGANQGWFGTGSGWFGTEGKLAPFFRKKLTEEAAKKAGTAYGGASLAKLGVLTAPLLAATKLGDVPDDVTEDFDHDLLKEQYKKELSRIKREAKLGTLDEEEFVYQGLTPEELTFPVKDGGRIGLYAGGQSTPSDYTMEDAMMTTTQDKLGGITDVMKQADLHRQGSVGQFYAAHGGSADDKLMARIKELQDEGLDYNSARAQAEKEAQGKAQGGRIGYAHGGAGYPPVTMGQVPQAPQAPAPPQRPHPMPAPQPNRMAGMNPMMRGNPMMNPMMGGRRMAQEGGLMDLGGMEKDYRQEGGFVPLGGEEKADDVPARLSKNEFVFTADAVRAAGGGDIDQGAEVMENVMKNLEQGGQVSEETQGLTGAQEMFGVSERLSEVV